MIDPPFTPGPWSSERMMIGTRILADGYAIAEVVGIADSHLANATLISKAPDLYKALAAIVATHRGTDTFVIQNARAVLADATFFRKPI